MIIHIIVAQNMVLCQDKAVGISSFCQLAETFNMQLFDMQDKTSLITGASSGLWEQFARCPSSAGARVLLAAQLREVSCGRRR